MTPEGSQRIPKGTNGRFKSPQSTVKQPPGPPGGCPEAAARLPRDPWGPMGGGLRGPRGHPRDLGIPGYSQGFIGTLMDPWECPSASLDSVEIAIHHSLACAFHPGTYVPLSHWYESLQASTSPLASGLSNVVGAGRVGCGKAGGLEANQVGALLCV